jgi:c-di-GMP-binding flagellar brake protein YcgR
MGTDTPQKIFLSDKDTASFECPKCSVSKEADVSKFKKTAAPVTLKIKCPCGNEYSVTLERRKYYRKSTKIPGKFNFSPLIGEDQEGSMTVMDISRGGLKFKIESAALFQRGDILEIEFNLDNKDKTLIKKQVYVRNVENNLVNVEFCAIDNNSMEDKAIGIYLY